MHRSTFLALTTAAALALGSGAALAQTQAERCLTMRLSLLGSNLSNALACHAWAVGTRTEPSASCLAHGEQQLAQKLRAAGCASDDEITDLLERARDATALLVDSQVADSRVAEYESTLWRTEVIADFTKVYTRGMPWPDQSCRSTGHCSNLMIFICQSTLHGDGSVETSCDTVPESAGQSIDVPVITIENVALPTGEILSRGSTGEAYEVVISIAPDGASFTGSGYAGSTPIFITGTRV